MTRFKIVRPGSVEEVAAIDLGLAKSLPDSVIGAIGGTRMTCEEVGCPKFENGWMTPVDITSDLGAKQAHWIRFTAGREFIEIPGPEASKYIDGVDFPSSIVVFLFPPGQAYCFDQHEDREVLFVAEGRGQRRLHTPEGFNEHFNEESYRIQRIRERG